MTGTTYPRTFDVVDDAPMADLLRLEEHLDAFNAAVTGVSDARSLSILLKDADGNLYAGLHGMTWGGSCHIQLLWIADRNRRRGLGTALLDAAEDEARRRGCCQILLWTHSFQAPDFYEKVGFERVVTVADNPVGHADIFMIKRLDR